MEYRLKLIQTEAATGYFACIPKDNMTSEEELAYLSDHPMDEFMHKYMLEKLGKSDEKFLLSLSERNIPAIDALIYELYLLSPVFETLKSRFGSDAGKRLSAYSPMIYIRSSLMENQNIHRQWHRIFENNLLRHQPLPKSDQAGLPMLFSESELHDDKISIRELFQDYKSSETYSRPDPKETARIAIEKLKTVGVLAGSEQRHHASLSLCAMLRQWNMSVSIKCGRHDYSLSGTQTAYGKGLDLDSARVSYAMEIVERCSSFASIEADAVIGYMKEYPLICSDYNSLIQNNITALNPDSLLPDVPYQNEKLYWMEAEDCSRNPIRIPVQSVFLFCNLDEINLFAGLGSTGLASGSTIEEAKVSALLEVIERDSESTGFYDEKKCFRLEAGYTRLSALLNSYREKGVDVIFQDITSPMGIPCYKCFVIAPDGEIVKGCGAHLDGRKAIVSALTETPWPYPYSPLSAKGPENLPTLKYEDLPDYSTGHPNNDLALLENLLTLNHHAPVYVNLTRKDLEIPVVRAIVPDMETSSERDEYSQISQRRFRAYFS